MTKKNLWLITFAITLALCLYRDVFIQIAIMLGLGLILYHVLFRPSPKVISKAAFNQPTNQRPLVADPYKKLMPVGQPKREKKQVQR